jgi:hypothetical protein
MKYFALLGQSLSLVLLTINVYSQTNTFPTTGNAGIGTTSPNYKVTIDLNTSGTPTGTMLRLANSAGTNTPEFKFMLESTSQHLLQIRGRSGSGNAEKDLMTFNLNSGNIGIGTTVPDKLLKLRKDVANGEGAFIHLQNGQYANANNATTGIKFSILDGRYALLQAIGEGVYGQVARLSLGLTDDADVFTERFSVLRNGNVLIGKTTQTNSTCKLDVNGKIRANEVVVNTTGADFVFGPDYKLLSLREVEKYITKNKHLPGINSADEMKENGMNVSEIQTKLLQKIEELTLYIIKQNTTNELQSREIENLKHKIGVLSEQLNQ